MQKRGVADKGFYIAVLLVIGALVAASFIQPVNTGQASSTGLEPIKKIPKIPDPNPRAVYVPPVVTIPQNHIIYGTSANPGTTQSFDGDYGHITTDSKIKMQITARGPYIKKPLGILDATGYPIAEVLNDYSGSLKVSFAEYYTTGWKNSYVAANVGWVILAPHLADTN